MDISRLEQALIAADKAGDTEAATALASELRRVRGESTPVAKPEIKNEKTVLGGARGNFVLGALDTAANIGSTLLRPIDAVLNATGLTDKTNKERREQIKQFFEQNADPDSLSFKGGQMAGALAGTGGVGGVLAKGASMVPALAPYASAIASGGFNLGNAATKSAVANGGIRALAGALQGGTQAALINPDDAVQGAAIGGLTPGAVKLAGAAGDAVRAGLDSGAHKLMQSALKPTLEQLRTGKAARAIDTLLKEGVNPTMGGVQKLGQRADDVEAAIDAAINGSTANISKADVMNRLNDAKQRFMTQVNPTADLAAIDAAGIDFAAHPLLASNDIPVKLAQELKRGTYQALKDKAYGEVKSASTEAQKALARGLKEEIANAVPSVGPLNARQSELINALKVAERRALMATNNNPVGLAPISPNVARTAAFLADRSGLVKGLLARGAYQASQANPVPKALTNMIDQYGLLGAPSVAPDYFLK